MLKNLTFSRGRDLFYNPREFQIISFKLFTLEGVTVLTEESRDAVLVWEVAPEPRRNVSVGRGTHEGTASGCGPPERLSRHRV